MLHQEPVPRSASVLLALLLLLVLMVPARILAHDLLVSTIDLLAGTDGTTVVVTMPLTELARTEHAGAGAMTMLEADVAIRRRLRLEGAAGAVGPGASSVSIDATADLVTWRAMVTASVGELVVRDRLLSEVPHASTRVRTVESGASHEYWLGDSAGSIEATAHAEESAGVSAATLLYLALLPLVMAALTYLFRRWHDFGSLRRVAVNATLALVLCGGVAVAGLWLLARVGLGEIVTAAIAQEPPSPAEAATRIDASFRPFAPMVTTRHDSQYFYVESNGMPDHRMMVGITAWQQQVPLPQSYQGSNAWRFPLFARPATVPLSAKDHFFRGAIAIAANGVPIFNPIKNDGRTDTFLAGELDEFGGHGGRADDYHYHLPPLHLQAVVGAALPVAFALDGYPVFGVNEPDGTAPGRLDVFNGHTTAGGGYHYHSTTTYPYLNGGFHGEVVELDGQVDPQPRATPARPAGTPLRGARITGFEKIAANEYRLTYSIGSETRTVHYTIRSDGTFLFEYVDGRGNARTETYRSRGR